MKALKLANEFRTSMTHEVMTSWGSDSAIELRRLAEVNAELLESLERLRRVAGVELAGRRDDVLEQADAAIAKAKEQQ